jgi:hypothetical protein
MDSDDLGEVCVGFRFRIYERRLAPLDVARANPPANLKYMVAVNGVDRLTGRQPRRTMRQIRDAGRDEGQLRRPAIDRKRPSANR